MVANCVVVFVAVSPNCTNGNSLFESLSKCIISDRAWVNWSAVVTCENGLSCKKNLTVSATRTPPVDGMKHLKHQ